ncbi:MAG TPA: AAA family ATPase [Planctomycetota bacterium]|jgi:CO dehydrogenase maturation factor
MTNDEVKMSWTVAITGKGGVGKSTLAALAVRWLCEKGKSPVLAVDADPNTCLDALLGVKAPTTVGAVREEAKRIVQEQAPSTGGMGKHELLDLKIQEALLEADGFDLIAMGRPEGPGCYCYANNVLRAVLSRLAGQYPSVVIDNEAGLENLSRRTVQKADWLLFVADPSQRGLTTARRLFELSGEMQVNAAAFGLVINRARDGAALARAKVTFEGTPVQVLGALPEDTELARRDEYGESVFSLPQQNEVAVASAGILERIV